jgi:hypothetical protein
MTPYIIAVLVWAALLTVGLALTLDHGPRCRQAADWIITLCLCTAIAFGLGVIGKSIWTIL